MPENLPVTKRINVMVGITRSKVIWSHTWSPWLSFVSADVSSGPGAFVGGHSPKGKLSWNNQIAYLIPGTTKQTNAVV